MKDQFTPWSEKEHAAHPSTHEHYQTSAKSLISFFGKPTLDAINSGHVERFKLFRSGEVSRAGTNRDLAALRLMFNFANRLGFVSQNPVKGVRFLPEGPCTMRAIPHDEERRYMAAANPLLRDVAALIVETGMRPQEVFTIRPENVHLTRRYLFVPTGKTRFARRNI